MWAQSLTVITPNTSIPAAGLARRSTTSPRTAAFDAHWAGFTDDESGIVKYEWAVGSGPRPSQQVMAFEDVGTATSASCSTEKCLHLEDGVTYYVTVRAWNGAGQLCGGGVGWRAGGHCGADAGRVWDGDGSVVEDVAYQASLDSLSARWSGFWTCRAESRCTAGRSARRQGDRSFQLSRTR